MFKNSLIYVIGLVISKGIFYLLTPLYTTNLNPSEFGIITILNSIIGFISIFIIFGMNSSMTRFYIDQNTLEERRVLISTSLIFLVTMGVIFSFLLYIFRMPLMNFLNLELSSNLFWILLFLSTTSVFQLIPQTILRMEEKALKFIILSTSDSLIVFIFTYLCIQIYNNNLDGAIYALVFARVVILVIYVIYILMFLKLNIFVFNIKLLKEMLYYGIPLIPHSLAIWITNLSDRIIIEKNLSILEVGIYSLGAQFGAMSMLLVTSFSQALTPNYYKRLKSGKLTQVEFNKLIITSSGVLSILAIILFTISPGIIKVISDDSYNYNYNFIGIILLASIFQLFYIFGFAPLSYYKKNKSITKVTFISSILNLILNLTLIPIVGILGAAISSVLSYFIRFVIVYYLSDKLTNHLYKWPKKTIILITFLLAIPLIGFLNEKQLLISIISILLIFFVVYNSVLSKDSSVYTK